MKIEQLEILKKYLGEKLAKSFINENPAKIKTLTDFIRIVQEKGIYEEKELKYFAIKYRDSIYGQTFLELLCVLDAHEVQIEKEQYKSLYYKYLYERTSDEEDYKKLLDDVINNYGNCNGFFDEKYIKESIKNENKLHFIVTVQQMLKKGVSIDEIINMIKNNDKIIGLQQLDYLREILGEEEANNLFNHNEEKAKTFANFIKMMLKKEFFTKDEALKMLEIYKNSKYGQTFLEMLWILETNNKIEIKESMYSLYQYRYLRSCNDETKYREFLGKITKYYGDCNGYLDSEYIDSNIQKEKQVKLQISVKEFIEKGGSIKQLKSILGKKEFDMDTKILVNNL